MMTPERDFQGQVRARLATLQDRQNVRPADPARWKTVSALHVVVWLVAGIFGGLLLVAFAARWAL